MNLELWPDDLLPEAENVHLHSPDYQHFKSEVQAALRLIGRGVSYRWQRDGYHAVNAPKDAADPLAAAKALAGAVAAPEEAQRFILGAIQSDFRRFDVAADARPELIEKHGTLRVVSEALAALKGGG